MSSEEKRVYLLLKAVIFYYHGLDHAERADLEEAARRLQAPDELKWAVDFIEKDQITAFDRARAMLAPLAETAGVTLTVGGDAGADDAIGWLDRERMVQLLSNLVGNAVKFTPRGGSVAVHYRVCGTTLEGAVADTGPGIAPDDIPRLFDAFWTGERRAGERNGHGAGLGLWIARGIVEAHGGTLAAVSVLGEGATFRFSIPLAAGELPDA